uniref:Uncharacterized protein n=1 Tax=Arcella intermedia TaxID=1963864 RepID=A0A6B2LKV2_9EUKA
MDTAGQEEYKALKDSYMARGEGFLLIYSITSRQSLDVIRSVWREQILRAQDKDSVPMVLCGNKCDLETERQVSKEEGESLAKSWNIPFFETSALSKQNAEESFHSLVREIRTFKTKNNDKKDHKKRMGCKFL